MQSRSATSDSALDPHSRDRSHDRLIALGVLLFATGFVGPRSTLASQECAYVASDTLVTIETTSNSIAASVPVGQYAAGPVALTPGGSLAFVGTEGQLDVLDTQRNRVVATIPLTVDSPGSIGSLPIPFGPYNPGPIAFLPDGTTAYVTGTYEFGAPARAALLFVIDVATRRIVRTVTQAENAAISADGRIVYAVRRDVWLQATEPPRLLFIDAATDNIAGVLPTLPYARKIVATADGRAVYLGSTGHPDSQIIRVDPSTRTVTGSIDIAGELTDLSVSGDAAVAYATTYNTDVGYFVLLDLSNHTEIGRIAFEGVPDAFAMTSDQARAYILLRPDIHRREPAVGVVDVATRAVITMIPLRAWGWAIDIATVPYGCSAPLCEGDCDDNGQVTVDEILAGVAIGLGGPPDSCAAYAEDDGGAVSIAALVRAINNALKGCG